MEDQVFDDDLLELGHYDAVTQTTTTYTVSLNALKAKNEATKERLGISEQNVMMGYQPSNDLEIMGSELIGGEIGGGNIASPDAIIGGDSQITPVDTTQHPYKRVLLLHLNFDLDNNGTYEIEGWGTGFLAGQNQMLTAAHNFYAEITQDIINTVKQTVPGYDVEPGYYWVDQCRIYPGHSSSTISGDPDDYYFPRNWTWPSQYIQEDENGEITVNDNYDWLLATLFSPLGESRGWFGICDPDTSINNLSVTVSGYPAASYWKKHYQYCTEGTVRRYGSHTLSYDNDTEGGNSGSPIYIYAPEEFASFPTIYVPSIVGIHTKATYYSNGTIYNSGVRVSDHLYNLVQDRILEYIENLSN